VDLKPTRDGNIPFQFMRHQQLIYVSLTQKSQEMADLYEAALRVCLDEGNPSRFVLAAHSIREMTGNLPKVLDLPVLNEAGRLGDQVDALEKVWDGATKSGCHHQGKWKGDIDEALRNLLQKIPELFEWRKKNRPKRRLVAAKMFRGTDPTGLPLPETLEQKRVKSYLDVHDYFVGVAHRGATTPEEFAAKLEDLERILLDSLCRTPSEDLSAIDRILEEGASDA
jgi:hypothetical protein